MPEVFGNPFVASIGKFSAVSGIFSNSDWLAWKTPGRLVHRCTGDGTAISGDIVSETTGLSLKSATGTFVF